MFLSLSVLVFMGLLCCGVSRKESDCFTPHSRHLRVLNVETAGLTRV
uniref:Uncharacterized protein n=1 Tax=Vitis vinifera TaxID=29760 RepID=F6H2E3_VITVI